VHGPPEPRGPRPSLEARVTDARSPGEGPGVAPTTGQGALPPGWGTTQVICPRCGRLVGALARTLLPGVGRSPAPVRACAPCIRALVASRARAIGSYPGGPLWW
jgi:hypothetical protein